MPASLLDRFEHAVDDVEQMPARVQDVAGIFDIARIAESTEQLSRDDFRKSDDGVERRAQFVTHIGKEARLRSTGGFGFVLGLFVVLLALLDLA